MASAGKKGSASAWLLVDGYNLTAMKPKSISFTEEAMQERTEGIGDTNAEHTPTGMKSAAFEQSGGYFDTTTNSSHAALSGSVPTSPQATQRVFCCGLGGQDFGEPFIGAEGAYTHTYQVVTRNGELTKADTSYLINGQIDKGQIIQPLATKTADWNTKTDGNPVDYTQDASQRVRVISSNSVANPTVVTTPTPHGLTTGDKILISGSNSTPTIDGDRAVTVVSETTFTVAVNVSNAGSAGTFVRSNSTSGAVGYQQVTAFSGFSGFVGKLRDSADDSTYADLISFANVTSAPGKERATVAGTIDRWVSYDGNTTGSGSITVFAGLARL